VLLLSARAAPADSPKQNCFGLIEVRHALTLGVTRGLDPRVYLSASADN